MSRKPPWKTCKVEGCREPRSVVVNEDGELQLHLNPQDKTTRFACRPSIEHESGLCYYHLKQSLGLFGKNPKAELLKALGRRKL